MAKNIKHIRIVAHDEHVVKVVNSTDALRKCLTKDIAIGVNYEYVNHYAYSKIMSLFTSAGCEISEIKY